MAKRKLQDPTLQEKFEELDRKNEEALLGGGKERIEQQHAKGKLTARERIDWIPALSKSWENSSCIGPKTSDWTRPTFLVTV